MSAETIAACREAIRVSDETAKAATPGPWEAKVPYGTTWRVFPESELSLATCDAGDSQNAKHIAANDPATRLALNAALTVVLDGIEEALDDHVCLKLDRCNVCRDAWPCSDRRIAIRSLAAIAKALGVQTA